MHAPHVWRPIVQLSRLLALVGFCGLLLLALMTTLDILMRWLLNMPLHGVNDISAVALAVVIAACLPANLAERNNVTVDILGNYLGARAKAALDAFGSFFTLVFVSLMAWRFVLYAQEVSASGQTTWVLKLPIAWAWWTTTAFIILSVPTQCAVLISDLMEAWSRPAVSGDEQNDGSASLL